MNVIGIGPMETLIILLVAFIFLGPERMVDAAKTLGKAVSQVRRMTADLPELTLDDDSNGASDVPTTNPGRRDSSGRGGEGDPALTSTQADESSPDKEGPVAFEPARETSSQVDSDPVSKQGQT